MASEVRVQELYVLMHVSKAGERLTGSPPAYTRVKANRAQRDILKSIAERGPGRKIKHPPFVTKFVRVDQALAAKLRLVDVFMSMWDGTHEFSIIPPRPEPAIGVPQLMAAIKGVRDAQG